MKIYISKILDIFFHCKTRQANSHFALLGLYNQSGNPLAHTLCLFNSLMEIIFAMFTRGV